MLLTNTALGFGIVTWLVVNMTEITPIKGVIERGVQPRGW